MSDETAGKTVLIVDDEPDVVSYLNMLLQDQGYATLSAEDGKEAMELMRSERPDLVTLDISMPEASGTRFYRDVKTDPELKDTPIVIVTAVTGYGGDPKGYEKFLEKSSLVPPPEGFFSKPIDRDEFLAEVEKLLTA